MIEAGVPAPPAELLAAGAPNLDEGMRLPGGIGCRPLIDPLALIPPLKNFEVVVREGAMGDEEAGTRTVFSGEMDLEAMRSIPSWRLAFSWSSSSY